jgi:hypothetical protein
MAMRIAMTWARFPVLPAILEDHDRHEDMRMTIKEQ